MTTPLDIIKKKRAQAISRIVGKGYLSTKRVYVGMATCEIAAGSKDVWDVFEQAIKSGGCTNVYIAPRDAPDGATWNPWSK